MLAQTRIVTPSTNYHDATLVGTYAAASEQRHNLLIAVPADAPCKDHDPRACHECDGSGCMPNGIHCRNCVDGEVFTSRAEFVHYYVSAHSEGADLPQIADCETESENWLAELIDRTATKQEWSLQALATVHEFVCYNASRFQFSADGEIAPWWKPAREVLVKRIHALLDAEWATYVKEDEA